MSEQVIKVAHYENYTVLTLNRPEKRNALNAQMLEAMNKELKEIERNKEVRAVMIRGEGRHFCAGIDLAELNRAEGPHNTAPIEEVFGRLSNLPAITIAAIQGAAITGGLELALHCDIRIAADDAKCGMTLGRVGLMVPYHFARKLIEVIGVANTALVLYTADLFDARRAQQIGLVNEVVPAAELVETATALAAKIAANAPLSLRAMKQILRRCMSTAFDTWHEDLLDAARQVRQSSDAREGVRAFLEKRKPVWRGE
jgi:enoyl-CoA hydratase/carnithine racemase